MLKPSTKTVVLFDTNAYRQLTGGAAPDVGADRVRRLLEAERAVGIQALASTIVQMELLARLADASSEDYANAKSALVALFEHCAQQVEGRRVLAVWVNSELQTVQVAV